jgi:excisionase family DNA binding protein
MSTLRRTNRRRRSLLRAQEVAKRLDISESKAYSLMASGEIAVVRIGRSVRVREQDLEAYIESNTARS